MDINNLETGKIYKNYKEFCDILGEDIKDGNSKKYQLKEWERYFKYSRQGRKFIVDEIFDEVKEKVDMRKNNGKHTSDKISYIENIEKLILDLLIQADDEEICLSKKQLFKQLKMVNVNYSQCQRRSLKLSKFVNIQESIINEWYDKTDKMLERNLIRALNNLQKKALINWQNCMTVCKIETDKNNNVKIKEEVTMNKYDEEEISYKAETIQKHMRATKEERRIITKIEKEILQIMEIEDKQKVVLAGKWNDYMDAVRQETINKLNIAYYYNSFDVVFTQEFIELELKKLKEKERTDLEKEVNSKIIIRSKNNAIKRQKRDMKKCESDYGEITTKHMKNHLSKKYVQDCVKLGNHLLDINHINIIDDVRKIKLGRD